MVALDSACPQRTGMARRFGCLLPVQPHEHPHSPAETPTPRLARFHLDRYSNRQQDLLEQPPQAVDDAKAEDEDEAGKGRERRRLSRSEREEKRFARWKLAVGETTSPGFETPGF